MPNIMSGSSTFKTKIVRVRYERHASGFYYASSDDIDGLVVSGDTLTQLDEMIDDVIVRLYAACGVKVMVTRIEESTTDSVKEWVAIPAAVAAKALEKADAATA